MAPPRPPPAQAPSSCTSYLIPVSDTWSGVPTAPSGTVENTTDREPQGRLRAGQAGRDQGPVQSLEARGQGWACLASS